MFLIDFILFGIGVILLLFGACCFIFSNKFFDFLSDMDLPPLFIMFGIFLCWCPALLSLLFNRCDSCQAYVRSDYCTSCGSFVASDSICCCGANLDERYSFCPSCGKELEDLDNEN